MVNINTIASVIGATAPAEGFIPQDISELVFDSRRVYRADVSLFFALSGINNDGHKYIDSLYQIGLRSFVVSRAVDTSLYPEANFLKVSDTGEALRQLAIWWRKQFPDLLTLGITGSNGKTIIKEWLWQILKDDYSIVRSPRSFNSQIGVPMSVWQIAPEHDLAIFEAGISRKGEMKKLAPIIDCSIGIFTNIGEAHAEGFDSVEQKIEEKLDLFESCKTIIYCADHANIDLAVKKRYADRELIAWSLTDKPLAQAIEKSLPFQDRASRENAGHVVIVLRKLGFRDEEIFDKLRDLQPVALRLELKDGVNASTIINDSYNADLDSLRIALDFMRRQDPTKPKVVILSDILQTGKDDDTLYKEIAELLTWKKIQRIYAIGSKIANLVKWLPEPLRSSCAVYPDTDSFLQVIKTEQFQRELILIKGARNFSFERIVARLERKLHRTVLELDLNAFANNYNVYRGLLSKETRLMAMVKASGYGSGTVEVGRLLEQIGADYLSVAYTDEGVELRNAGIGSPILVLNPEDSAFEALLMHNLEPELYSLSLLKSFISFSMEYRQKSGDNRQIGIHIKLDTGMHRLGFEDADLPELADLLKQTSWITVKTVFSHLSASDNPAFDDFTREQICRYELMYGQLTEMLGYKPWRHILNSGGISRYPEYHWEMVRLGIGLYGVDGSNIIQERLHTVSTLKAEVSQVKYVQKGETVGYNRSGKAERDLIIATISIGYADGFSRSLSNGKGQVVIRGRKAPVIGNVCMDMTMIDVTDIPNVAAGDEVLIFGKEQPVQEFSAMLGTIPYEVFTNISSRVRRVVYQE